MSVTIELTKDKFGETITISDKRGTRAFAERNMYERKNFEAYKKYIERAGEKVIISFLDEIDVVEV